MPPPRNNENNRPLQLPDRDQDRFPPKNCCGGRRPLRGPKFAPSTRFRDYERGGAYGHTAAAITPPLSREDELIHRSLVLRRPSYPLRPSPGSPMRPGPDPAVGSRNQNPGSVQPVPGTTPPPGPSLPAGPPERIPMGSAPRLAPGRAERKQTRQPFARESCQEIPGEGIHPSG